MNLLVDELPTAVMVGDKIYAINTGFRACIRTILAFEDVELTGQEKQMVMLSNLYPVMPDDPGGAIEQALKFLNGGKLDEVPDESPLRLYSFQKDASLIFAAFRQTHGIDLETAALHWWAFLALFADLGADTTFCFLIGLRKRLKNGTASKEERASAREMSGLIDLPEPDNRTDDEKMQEAEFMRLIGKVGAI